MVSSTHSLKVPVLELSWSCGLKPAKTTKKGWVNSRIQWFYCIKAPWAFLNFIFHSEHASTDGAQAKLRSCLDLWWEKHSFEYCLKLRRWVHISEDTLTGFCFVLFTNEYWIFFWIVTKFFCLISVKVFMFQIHVIMNNGENWPKFVSNHDCIFCL